MAPVRSRTDRSFKAGRSSRSPNKEAEALTSKATPWAGQDGSNLLYTHSQAEIAGPSRSPLALSR
eukprot:11651927-Alexandrium_andersonii.AAC.1